ncbi:MAG: hypothetical protein JSS39_04360 [Nitrospira sp.]|nr:hypothetical protein [Nitrospira sp.]
MARPHDSERYNLSDAEKRDLIKLIEQGASLFSTLRHSRESGNPWVVAP